MRSKRPTLLLIITLTTVTIVFWIAYEVYLILITKPPSSIDPKILEPLNPTLDTETLDNLNQRIYFTIDQEVNPVIDRSDELEQEELKVSPTVNPTPTDSEDEQN